MSQRGMAVAGMLFVALFANAAVKSKDIRIQVLDSETHSVVLDDSGVAKNCDGVNFDAYCHNSKTTEVTNTLLVQEGSESPYRVTCTVDTKWSSCVPLERGHTFEARRNKHGLLVYYVDEKGKVRKQLYLMVAPDESKAEPSAVATAAPVAAAPNPGPAQKSGQVPVPGVSDNHFKELVKISFSSTPAGAEVTIDGQYVGSTPSALGVGVGNHTVEVSLPGFEHWKRDLTVSKGSDLTVNAVLQKMQ